MTHQVYPELLTHLWIRLAFKNCWMVTSWFTHCLPPYPSPPPSPSMPDENALPSTGDQWPIDVQALKFARRKKLWVLDPISNSSHQIIIASCMGDPLTSHGWHFSRTVHAMCNVQVLLTQGLECLASPEDVAKSHLFMSTSWFFFSQSFALNYSYTQGKEGTSSIQ